MENRESRFTLTALLFIGCAVILFIALRETAERRRAAASVSRETTQFIEASKVADSDAGRVKGTHAPKEPETAAENVARRLGLFANQRRDITYQLAAKYGIAIDPEVAEFYEAVEKGDWHATTNKFRSIWKRKDSDDPAAESLRKLAAPMLETFGVAEQAREWPPEKLLEYGHAILDSLKPGMVYIGGTDSGRFVPTLLNDTGPESERHIVITQNGLADRTYADYFGFLYNDQLAGLDPSDSDQAFQAYIADAQKRLEHDRAFPNEPKQVREGEDIKVVDGKVQVGGQVAVMDINERLLNKLIQKNPGFTFALEESFSLTSTYAAAKPLGPILEINSADGAAALTADNVNDALSYWRNTARQITSDPVSANSENALKTYSHMASAQGHFLANRGYTAQSEEAYRLALQIWPENPEAKKGLQALKGLHP